MKKMSRRTCDVERVPGLDATGIGANAVLFRGSGFDLVTRGGSVYRVSPSRGGWHC